MTEGPRPFNHSDALAYLPRMGGEYLDSSECLTFIEEIDFEITWFSENARIEMAYPAPVVPLVSEAASGDGASHEFGE